MAETSATPDADLKFLVGTSVAVAVAMIAQQIAGKAVRDAYFLSVFEPDVLARVMTASSLLSVVAVLGTMRLYRRFAPASLVPALFSVSALLFITEAALAIGGMPKLAALVLYVHTASFGAISISGFWAVMNERYDPHTAKRVIGRVASGATLGGLIGGVAAWQAAKFVSVPVLLMILSAVNAACAIGIRAIGPGDETTADGEDDPGERIALWRMFEKTPYLRDVALLVVLLAFGTAGVDFVFKTTAAARYTDESALIGFFSLFYLLIGVGAFVVQSSVAGRLLRRFGIAASVATLPLIFLTIGPLALLAPGVVALGLLRGGASTVESSTYRSGYELLYTPLASNTKRPAKTLIDVGGDKLGAAAGGAFAVFLVGLIPNVASFVLIAGSILCGIAALVVSRRLARGYLSSLATSLADGTAKIEDLSELDRDSRNVALETIAAVDVTGLGGLPQVSATPRAPMPRLHAPEPPVDSDVLDAETAQRLGALVSANPESLDWVLRQRNPIPRPWVAALVPLLGESGCADIAEAQLRRVAPAHIGLLVDALFDRALGVDLRVRVASILTSVPSQRCANALMSAVQLGPIRLRFALASALREVALKNPAIEISDDTIDAAASAELKLVRRPELANESLPGEAHYRAATALMLLSISVPSRRLNLALEALAGDDPRRRGTGLEYLENLLPDQFADSLVPLLQSRSVAAFARRQPDAIAAQMAKPSAALTLETLRRRLEERSQ